MGDKLEYSTDLGTATSVMSFNSNFFKRRVNCGIKMYASEQWQRLALIQSHDLDNLGLSATLKSVTRKTQNAKTLTILF